jgi:SHS2 domain-containing protein
MLKYEFLEHPADLKIKAYGQDLPELFINTALGMTEFLFGKISDIKETAHTEKIKIQANNTESLLIDWLSEILYLSDKSDRAYLDYQIEEFSENKIAAKVGSVKFPALEDIKAVTYSELEIKKVKDGWQAIVVFDI